ncbi:hypothetical protein FQN54_000599 [Arachnomyces sp. PD_36]|nr:hypothetical protein FQN54_000599 [Arachnomyces sp. PD_36]
MSAVAPVSTFEDAIAVKPLSSHTYSAYLRDEWCIGTVPHGGYVTSLFQSVATAHFKNTHPQQHGGSADPFTLHLTFLRRTSTGPAVFTVQDSKLGARTSTIHITLSQVEGGKQRDEVVAYISCTNLLTEEGLTSRTDWEIYPPVLPPRGGDKNGTFLENKVDLRKLTREGADGIWKRFEAAFPAFRKASTHIEVFIPELEGYTPGTAGGWKHRRGIGEQWVRFAPYGKIGNWTDPTLGYLIDMFPMMLEGFDQMSPPSDKNTGGLKKGNARFWYPTVLLNVDIKKKLPPGGVEWLYVRVQNRKIKDGRFDIDIVVLDEDGDVVAISNQVALAVSASRNAAARGQNKGAKPSGESKI